MSKTNFEELKAKQEMMDTIKSASGKERMIMLFRMIEKFGSDAFDVIGSVTIIPYNDYRMTDGLVPANVIKDVLYTIHTKNKIQGIKELRNFTEKEFGKPTGLRECKEVVELWIDQYDMPIESNPDENADDPALDTGIPDGMKPVTVPVVMSDGTKVGENIINVPIGTDESTINPIIMNDDGDVTKWTKLKDTVLATSGVGDVHHVVTTEDDIDVFFNDIINDIK
jgi:hypothetical protein